MRTRGDRAGAVFVSSLPESPPGQDGPEHQLSTLGVPLGNDGLLSTEKRGFLRKENMPWRHEVLNLEKIDHGFPFP